MGMAAMIGVMAVSAIGSIAGGIAAQRAAEDEADALAAQAAMLRQEALEEAERIDKEHTRFLARQSLMFLKGGVSLSGSPLLVLEETREEREKRVQAQIDRANALYTYGMSAAARAKSQGRSALIGGVLGAATSTATMYMAGSTAGIFSQRQTAPAPAPASTSGMNAPVYSI